MTGSVVSTSPNRYPALVAKQGFEAIIADNDSVLGGSFKSRMEGLMNEVLPETFKAKQAATTTKPRGCARPYSRAGSPVV